MSGVVVTAEGSKNPKRLPFIMREMTTWWVRVFPDIQSYTDRPTRENVLATTLFIQHSQKETVTTWPYATSSLYRGLHLPAG